MNLLWLLTVLVLTIRPTTHVGQPNYDNNQTDQWNYSERPHPLAWRENWVKSNQPNQITMPDPIYIDQWDAFPTKSPKPDQSIGRTTRSLRSTQLRPPTTDPTIITGSWNPKLRPPKQRPNCLLRPKTRPFINHKYNWLELELQDSNR
jgi:hypothetical protein